MDVVVFISTTSALLTYWAGSQPTPVGACHEIFEAEDSHQVRVMQVALQGLAHEEIIVRTPSDAAYHFMNRIYVPFEQFDQEELWTLLLNTKNRITHDVMVYRGTLNSAHVRLAELFKEAVRNNSASMVISHCHPSGDPTPQPRRCGGDGDGGASGATPGYWAAGSYCGGEQAVGVDAGEGIGVWSGDPSDYV